ncbi:hypothetical protein [Mucilaginibacter agri]|uniref:Uncharacterized protein n=1 Tax=Mucilaginibacter agri TaxID=2695265 RepID=A0A966DT43_9SPHI|nr:hypothetical protein [Mucilaginibacter agri]NCD70853.1 hypothetical protein [Mucilaginibacter agri]
MKNLKKLLRLCWLIIYMTLAVAGIAISGAVPVLSKNRELFIDNEPKIELVEEHTKPETGEELKF